MRTRLPIDELESELTRALQSHQNLVLVAEPGAGKTTRFPVTLLKFLEKKKIAVLEPRRVAARAAAVRIASENEGFELGREVGYSVRFDRNLNDATPIAFYTEGLFLQQLKSNPRLEGYSAVVLDEFHERSRHTDLAIGLLMELQSLERPDLRIVVMSATLDAARVSSFLTSSESGIAAPIVNVPGRTHPVEIRHGKEPLSLSTDRAWTERVLKTVTRVYRGEDPVIGDVLVFLPGVGEIRRLREALEAQSIPTCELHGQLTLDEQSAVLKKADEARRVILATNIAETSLTIDGVGTVIDTGLQRVSRLDRLGFPQLQMERISKSSAKQRGGRAGRQFPGLNYRLWSKLDENSFPEFDEPELERTDLSESLLELIGLTGSDPRSFSWFQAPPAPAIERGLELLKRLDAIDEKLQLTALGRKMLQTNTGPRLAKLLTDTSANEPLRALLVTILQERDFIFDAASAHSSHDCDLFLRAEYHFGTGGGGPIDRTSLQTQKKVYRSLCSRAVQLSDWDTPTVERLLLRSFPDRVCRRRAKNEPRARMVGGRGVELGRGSQVRDAEYFIALRGEAGMSRSSRDPIATMATPVSRESIERVFANACTKRAGLIFDESNRTVYRETATSYLDLPLENGNRERPTPDEALPLLLEWAKENQAALEAEENFARLKGRILWLKAHAPNPTFDLSDDEWNQCFQQSTEETLYGQTSAREIDLTEAFTRAVESLKPGFMKQLNAEAPSHFQAPTGNRFAIDYTPGQNPSVEVRLQELFGLGVHPSIARGLVPLTLKLLGPNYRPVQVTSDLVGFWKGSYFEVKKELKARYPKHSWPDRPDLAAPEAKGHRRR